MNNEVAVQFAIYGLTITTIMLARKRTTRGRPPKRLIVEDISTQHAQTSKSASKPKVTKTKVQAVPEHLEDGRDLSDILANLTCDNVAKAGSNLMGDNVTKDRSSAGYQYQPPLGQNSFSDPLIYLQRNSVKANVIALNIVDYVNITPPTVSVPSPGASVSDILESLISIKAGPKKPKLEEVQLEDWLIANTRIMDNLYPDPGPGVRDYWSYTIKIGEYFRMYDRVSVLLYDQEYRFLQAQHRFRWGTDVPHLQNIRLVHKSASQGRFGYDRTPAQQGSKSNDVCKQYNGRVGCSYGHRCKFQHVCFLCKGKHPRFAHPADRSSSSPTIMSTDNGEEQARM